MTDIMKTTLDDLWSGAPESDETFDPTSISHFPEPARRYLEHTIAPGTPLASAVRLEMTGQMRLKEKWLPFEAQQVIRWDRGLIWKAKVKMGLLSIKGSDRFIDGEGAMRWKLLGLIPVVKARGPDISRSAVGRLQIESMWLPSVLLSDEVAWDKAGEDPARVQAHVSVMGHEATITLEVDEEGRLKSTQMQRWGDPEGGEFQLYPFGGLALRERTFQGYTVPTELRVGWYFGTPRFDEEGEFWRATIHSMTFR